MSYLVQNKEDLDQQINEAGGKLIVIDFFANWCQPCKVISPKMEELAEMYAERAVVLKVNVDGNEELAEEYSITGMPSFVFIKNGKVLELVVGANPARLCKSMQKHATDIVEFSPQVVVPQAVQDMVDETNCVHDCDKNENAPVGLNDQQLDK